MKIAIASKRGDFNSEVDETFGRCSYFLIIEIKDKKIGKIETIKNENQNQMGGAGIQTAKLVAEQGAEAVIAKNMGPRASAVLNQFNISIYLGDGLVKDVLQLFINDKLEKYDNSDSNRAS